MPLDSNINVCQLLIGTLWAGGFGGFLLISTGLLSPQHGGLSLVCFVTASTLYLRCMIRSLRVREDVAFELGRRSQDGHSARVQRIT